MALNYKPLWIQLAKKGLKKTDVIDMAGLTTNVMAQMGKDKPITFKNLEKICKGSDEFSEMMSNTPLILYRLMQG